MCLRAGTFSSRGKSLNPAQYIYGPGSEDAAQLHTNLLICSGLQSAVMQMVHWHLVR